MLTRELPSMLASVVMESPMLVLTRELPSMLDSAVMESPTKIDKGTSLNVGWSHQQKSPH